MSAVREIRPHGPVTLREADSLARLNYRQSALALSLDAILADVGYLQHLVELVARGGPLPTDAPQRVYRIALRLHDARTVLEAAQ